MALIKCKNGDLYRRWIAYLCKIQGEKYSNPTIRTEAFFSSQRGIHPPLF